MNDLIQRLHLEGKLLRPADVLQISSHSLDSTESCTEENLIHNFLQNLMMMNYRARYFTIKNKQDFTQQKHNDSFEDADIYSEMCSSNKTTSESDSIHPMDVQMAVFHCADSFLKQLMVTKLSHCQFALPLLVPDPFTQEIEFPLWTFRQINKSWKVKDSKKQIVSKLQPVWKAETPMVFFFRFDSVSSSKSQLMNNLINEKHNTFFHRNCPGSSKTRVLMDGVVEIAWYCPSGKNTDKFTQCVAFCNLHGDAGVHEKQLQILTEMASVNVVILPQLDRKDKSSAQIQKLYRDRKPLICLFTEDECSVTEARKGKYKIGLKDRNQSDIYEELRRAIKICLSEQVCNFRLEDMAKYSDIIEDEKHNNDCKEEKYAAQKMMDLLKQKTSKSLQREIKESFLPCQGKLWHQWCEKNKELHRPLGNEIEMHTSKTQKQMKTIREEQYKSGISDFMKLFITEMNTGDANKKIHFLKWLIILLDEHTSADLCSLQHKYKNKWSKVLQLKKEKNGACEMNNSDEHAELNNISKDLQDASFGLEHILREIGQIYESCKSQNKNKEGLPCDFSSLPNIAVDMMISGFPLELMDGDAAHVPVVWVSAVLDKLIEKLDDKRVFVLSVLGIQSSGKSTMLNAMFGLQFAVSAGRCTRGAFMQLVKVAEEMKTEEQLKFDYILVVDTEGLHALELTGKSTRHHDNELATFVVGLGNMTLINILGENPNEMQEILQIVVQAFMRMKKVNLSPSCMFVHQNVSDVRAEEGNVEGRRRLQETLDEMTKLAAKDEVCDAECFSDVINFDIQKDVKYFAQLWEGSPPMAPPNPDYHENVKDLKTYILSHALKSDGMMLTDLKDRIRDLWEALLNEQFVFSFRNSLEISAYKKLETEYSKWSWSLHSAMLETQNKLHNKIENEVIDKVEETDLQTELEKTSEEVEKSMSEFFKTDTYAAVLIQWETQFKTKIKELQENIVKETTQKLKEILRQRDLKKVIEAQRTRHLNTLFNKSKELALKLRDKAKDKETLMKEFDLFWENSVKMIITDTKTSITDIDVLGDMKQLFSKSVHVDAWTNSRDIFSVPSYSDYVQVMKSSGFKANVTKYFNAVRERFGYNLPNDDETQIRALVNNIAHETDTMIKSNNIATLGYNKSYVQKLEDHITSRVTEHEEQNRKYKFKTEFLIDLIYSICKRAKETFTEQHRRFKEANDPVLYLKKKREEYYSIFQKHLNESASAAIFGEIISQKLKEPIQQSVYKNTAINLSREIKNNCPLLKAGRSEQEKHILKTLAEVENFSAYVYYINDPKDFFKSFISDVVNQYITDKFSQTVLPEMKKNTQLLQKRILKAAHESTIHVQKNSGSVDLWLDHFTKQLSEMMIFSVKSFSGVNLDGIDDFNLLEQVLSEEINLSDISDELTADQFEQKLNLKDRPAEILSDELCRCCWVQCPFCGATCTNRIENHPGDHSVSFHRVTGLNKMYYDETQNLCTDFCSTVVASKKTFKSSDRWIRYKDYKRAGGVYANWKITPDFSELTYWKWFVCRFQKDLEMYYGKSFKENGAISKYWTNNKKENAIESLGNDYIFNENEDTWRMRLISLKIRLLKIFSTS